jgi:acyl-CoA synthetase (AMP-forming)/AMP-acid ligase II
MTSVTNNPLLAELAGEPLPNTLSIFQHLEKGLQNGPYRPAIICMHQPSGHLSRLLTSDDAGDLPIEITAKSITTDCLSITYTHLFTAAKRLIADWVKRGLCTESTILMCIPNGGEFCILFWACILMRMTMVCVDPSILAAHSHQDLKDILRSIKPSIVVVPDRVSTVSVDIAIQGLHAARPLGIMLAGDSSEKNWLSFSTFADEELSEDATQALLEQARNDDPERICSILFTSGTSGKPKGCPLRVAGQSHFLESWSWLLDEENSQRALQQAHNSRAIAPTQMLQTWSKGGTVLMPSRNFQVEDTITAIDTFGATFVVLSPAMVHSIADTIRSRPSIDLKSVRTVQIGGDAVNKTVLLKCAALFPRAQVCTHHGMSEGVAAFKWAFFDMPVTRIPFLGETCPTGSLAPGSMIRIWNTEKQRTAIRGEQGEMHLSSPSIIQHYLRGESETSFYDDIKGRWFITGDMATMDQAGIIYILGRSKDVIRRAGNAIVPSPMESLIQQYLSTSVSHGTQTYPNSDHQRLIIIPFVLLGMHRRHSPSEIWGSCICSGQEHGRQNGARHQTVRE